MNFTPFRARQPVREPWSHERLVRERALALCSALDLTTQRNYGSACNSYLAFVRMHDLPVDPTPDTLSFYIVYMCRHIKPTSVSTYLSGLVNQLEPFFPNVKEARFGRLVRRTLKGCQKLYSDPVTRKRALTRDEVDLVIRHYNSSTSHNDKLFLSMFLTAFFALLRLGELTFPDDQIIRDWRKIARRSTVKLHHGCYEFTLPSHKADRTFAGSQILVCGDKFNCPSLHHFNRYLASRDLLFPLTSPLWLTEAGVVPNRTFFISRLRLFFLNDVAGQSLRAGGATMLAELGLGPHIIQAAGRWSSEAFRIYVRKNPFLLQGLIFGKPRSN
jgi:hypothetical protein